MSTSHAHNRWDYDDAGGDIERQLEDIDGHLLDDVEDERLQSSVPSDYRASDLSFIGMTGLTRPAPAKETASTSGPTNELDPSKPVSFYEPGVDDVDAMEATQGIDVAENDQQDVAPAEPPSSLTNLKEIIAELARAEETQAPPEAPEEPGAPPVDEAEISEPEPAASDDATDSAEGNGHRDTAPEPETATQGDASTAGFDDFDTSFDRNPDATTQVDPEAMQAGHEPLNEDWLADALEFDQEPKDETPPAAPEVEDLPEPVSSPEDIAVPDTSEEPTALRPEEIDWEPRSDEIPGIEIAPQEVQSEMRGTEPEPVDAGPELEDAVPEALEVEAEDTAPREQDIELDAQDHSAAPDLSELTQHDVAGESEADSEAHPFDARTLFGNRATMDGEPVVGPPDADGGLDEFRAYLHELEGQPRDLPTGAEASLEESPEAAVELEDDAGFVYRRPRPARQARRTKKRDKVKRVLIRWTVRLIALAAIALIAYQGYRVFNDWTASPAWLMDQAAQLAQQGEFEKASEAYQRFLQRFPDDPRRADAQFEAALNLYLADKGTSSNGQLEEKALALFRQFVGEHPDSPRTARARSLMGIIEYRLGHYEQAVTLLRDPNLRLQDPVATLPALRVLAQAYIKLGEFDAAESVYLQAASMTGNVTPDIDYIALGNLYQQLAEQAQSEDDRRRYLGKAVEEWNQALALPGIDPETRATLETKRNVTTARLNPGAAHTGEDNATPDAAAAAPSAATPNEPAVSEPAPKAAAGEQSAPGPPASEDEAAQQ